MPKVSVGKFVKVAGIGSCGCVLTFLLVLGTFLYMILFTNTCAKMLGEETYPLTSNPKNFDPFVGIEEVRSRVSPKAKLVSVRASFVRSDGTMDLTATYKPAPRVTYEFDVELDKAPAEAPPIGAGRGPNDVWVQRVRVDCYEPGQRRHVRRISGGSSAEYNYTNEGMDVDRGTPGMSKVPIDIGKPKLSTAEIWKAALAAGAPRDAVASIEYSKDGFDFSISGTGVDLEFDKEGKPKQ